MMTCHRDSLVGWDRCGCGLDQNPIYCSVILSPGHLILCVRHQESSCLDPRARDTFKAETGRCSRTLNTSHASEVCAMCAPSYLVKQEPPKLTRIMPECNTFITPLYKDYISRFCLTLVRFCSPRKLLEK